MEENKTSKKKVKVVNIILNVICVLIFTFAAYELILKFTNNSIYLFGVRSDVVLTNSMSFKNEDPRVQLFLEGHDDQLQRGDLVYSTKVKKDTELNVYDIVLFINKDNNKLTIHRIVDIRSGTDYLDGQPRYLIRADTANIGSHDGLYKHDEIIAKYKSKIPGIGHVHNFFTSIFGIILEVGVIIIIVLYQYFDDKYFKKKQLESSETLVEEITVDNQTTEESISDNSEELDSPPGGKIQPEEPEKVEESESTQVDSSEESSEQN